MALDKATLKNDIKSLLQDMMQKENASFDEFAERLSNAVHDYVTGAEVFATPAQVLAASMANGAGSVVAANNMEVTLL